MRADLRRGDGSTVAAWCSGLERRSFATDSSRAPLATAVDGLIAGQLLAAPLRLGPWNPHGGAGTAVMAVEQAGDLLLGRPSPTAE